MVLGSFFALLAVFSGALAYYSITIGKTTAALLRVFVPRVKNPAIGVDEWFLIALSLLCAIAAIAFLGRGRWVTIPAVAEDRKVQ